jgi:nucleoside-diphosphate-sugar epimerase
VAWSDLASHFLRQQLQASVVWLLDGAKHAETDRLAELLGWATPATHVVLVSTCTVYGDQHGRLCAEDTPLHLVTPHARVKATCEQMLIDSGLSWCVLRLGALYGVDDRGIRADRIEKWVTRAASDGVVTVPEPIHWRGWLHRDQAARALVRAASRRTTGVLNAATANMTFADAVSTAAGLFDARIEGDGKPDPCNYQVDSTAARHSGLLDERPAEDLPSSIRAFADTHTPTNRRP